MGNIPVSMDVEEQLLRFWPTPATPVADAEPATEEKRPGSGSLEGLGFRV